MQGEKVVQRKKAKRRVEKEGETSEEGEERSNVRDTRTKRKGGMGEMTEEETRRDREEY